MDNGWSWNIPFHDADHRGYVFSSAFCSVDQAVEEMVRKIPGISKPWSLKFRSGRHEQFWRGNVVAVGNSYGFVEPLESTGLEMLTIEIDLLIDHLPASRHDRSVKQSLNRRLNAMWDDLRGLLAVHYKFNRRIDTPFWRACQQTADLGTAAERVSLFTERGPLTEGNTLLRSDSTAGFFSQNYIYDVLLCGMQVPARYFQPFESREDLHRRQRYYRECAHWAVPQADAWNMLYEQPETLRSIFGHPESWSRSNRF
jgi:tryptophan halogenase